jgi:hypothetical protein
MACLVWLRPAAHSCDRAGVAVCRIRTKSDARRSTRGHLFFGPQPPLMIGGMNDKGKSLLIFRNCVKSRNQKYTAFAATQITAITPAIHPGNRGVSRSSRTRGWMRWTQRRRARSWSQGGFSRERFYVCADDRRFKAFARTSHRHLAGRSDGVRALRTAKSCGSGIRG